ncbi:MAG: hypothetical protein HYU58_01500 [Proteobacteria bacterium]|nr:hypothetical protein [Pseudomonadota bacterium]
MDSIAPRLKKIAKSRADHQITQQRFAGPSVRTTQKATAKLLTKAIPDLGNQAKSFENILNKHKAQSNVALKKARQAAIKDSRGQKAALAALIARKAKAFELLAQPVVNVPSTQYHLLNTPFEISSSAGMPLSSSSIVPSSSFAKFTLHVSDGYDGLNTASFKYVWVNPFDRYVVVNVHGYIVFRGHCYWGADGGFFGGDRYVRLQIDGKLELFDWSNPDPISIPVAASYQSANVLTAEEDQGGWWDVGAVGAQDIFRGYDLSHELLVVPPRATMGFVMTAAIDCKTGDDSGLVDIDFASGNFQVSSPAVLLAIVS